jgi:two-component system chemotaxis sensor kinase CheA
MDEFELELIQDFFEEAHDLLNNIEGVCLRLAEDSRDPASIDEIFRAAHCLKGTSKAVGFDQLSEVTHIAENLILKLKQSELDSTPIVVSGLLAFYDKIVEMIDSLKIDNKAQADITDICEYLNGIAEGRITDEVVEEEPVEEEPVHEEVHFEAPVVAEMDEVVEEEIPINAAALESLLEVGGSIEDLPANVLPIESQVVESQKVEPQEKKQEKTKPKSKAKKTENKEDESIRVKLERINHLTDIVGELVILQTVLNQRKSAYIEDDLSNQSIGMMSKLFKEVQELTMSLRMLPLKSTFQKMNRIVRDTSQALDKKVKLHVLGEETEVDKTVLEHLADPLVHMVRNAVDHGLETNIERLAVGKSEYGQVELMAFHEGSNLVIQVTDDGKGIDPEVIRQKAVSKGIINANASLSDQEILQLVFQPGFSTKEVVTEVSGRGVGMDVVKNNIEQMGGEVKLLSKLGQGSSFKVVLPLTLAIIDGLVVNVGDNKFVIPLGQVHELVLIPRDEIEVFSGAAELCRVRGEVYPLFFLNSKLGEKRLERTSETVIIVKGQGQTYGVSVDNIVNQQQIVIKKLGDDIRDKKGIMGSAIMGDGRPSFILDVHELFKDDFKKSRGYEKMQTNSKKAA